MAGVTVPTRRRSAAATGLLAGVLAAALALPAAVGSSAAATSGTRTAPGEPSAGPSPASAAAPVAPAQDLDDSPPTSADARIAEQLPSRLADRRLGATVGIAVVDAGSGRTVVADGGQRRLLPASNMKVLTATAVLTVLGPKHRFTTSVARTPGSASFVLVGGGDPLLSTGDLQTLAKQAANAYRADPAPQPAGVRPTARPRVTVRIDDSLFPKPTRGPGWTGSYMPYSGAPVRPLARLGDYSWDTAANAAGVFAQALRRQGLRATVDGRATAEPGAAVVARVRPHTVADAVRTMLLVSENNVAEVLFRHVGLATSGDTTWAGASRAVSSVLEGLGVETGRLRISDGSGLSRTNRVTPLALAETLSLATRDDLPRLRTIYADRALPTAGRTGTLGTAYGRYTTRPSRCAQGQVFAKTGSLFDTIALSGIAEGADGRPKAFSFLVNDRPTAVSMLSTRQALDGLAATVVGCW